MALLIKDDFSACRSTQYFLTVSSQIRAFVSSETVFFLNLDLDFSKFEDGWLDFLSHSENFLVSKLIASFEDVNISVVQDRDRYASLARLIEFVVGKRGLWDVELDQHFARLRLKMTMLYIEYCLHKKVDVLACFSGVEDLIYFRGEDFIYNPIMKKLAAYIFQLAQEIDFDGPSSLACARFFSLGLVLHHSGLRVFPGVSDRDTMYASVLNYVKPFSVLGNADDYLRVLENPLLMWDSRLEPEFWATYGPRMSLKELIQKPVFCRVFFHDLSLFRLVSVYIEHIPLIIVLCVGIL